MDSPTYTKPSPVRRTLGWVAVIALILVVAWFVDIRGSGPDAVPWVGYDEAVEAAAEADKPMLLNFTADWCGPCQEMKRSVYSQDHVADAITERFVPVKVDLTSPSEGDVEAELAEAFGIRSIPSLVVLDSRGGFITQDAGYFDGPEAMLAWLEEVYGQRLAGGE